MLVQDHGATTSHVRKNRIFVQVLSYLSANSDSVGNVTESFTELQAVITLGWFCESRELVVLSPVEFSGIDNDTSDCVSVSTNPLGSTVDDDVGTIFDRLDDIAWIV